VKNHLGKTEEFTRQNKKIRTVNRKDPLGKTKNPLSKAEKYDQKN
jgi:hypothetical protein